MGVRRMTEEEDKAREEEAAEAIEQNEEEGQPQFPGDKGVAPDQADPGEESTEEDDEEETTE